MADPGGVWKTIKAISPKEVEDEASIGFKLALIGKSEDRARLRAAFLTRTATVLEQEEADNHLREFDTPPDADTAKAFAFSLYAGPEGEPVGARGPNSVPFAGTPEQIVDGILARRPDLCVALARRFPLFRLPACSLLIRSTSRINASIAFLSALPGILPPVAGIILPGASMADVFLLTKNQTILVMRLAAAHGRKPSYKGQVKELIGTVGSALGWRTLARELVGLVPGGVGAVIKATIAYSGTVAVGKAALIYYQTGKKATPAQIQAAYAESQEEAKREAEALKH